MSKKGSGPAERRAFSFEVKALDDTGTFEGYANTYDRDSYGDEVQPGAFKRTLELWRGKGKRIPMLSQHDPTRIVGYFEPSECFEDTKGLRVKGQFLMDTEDGRDHYAMAKAGLLDMSIGFDTLRDEVDAKTKTRKLHELRLWEISVVTFPANEHSRIEGVKAMDFATAYAQQQAEQNLRERRWRMDEALWSVLLEAFRSEDLDDTAKLQAIDASLGQWHQAMLAWASDAITAKLYTQKGDAGPDEVKAGRRHSKATLEKIEAAKASAEQAVEHLAALLGMDMPSDEEDDQDGNTKSAPTPGTASPAHPEPGAPDAKALSDVARLTSEIKTAVDERKALDAIALLQRSMSA